MKPLRKLLCLGLLVEIVLAVGFGIDRGPWITCKAEQTGAHVRGTVGITTSYPGDRGISEDPAVVFSDDFETWTQGGTRPSKAGWNIRKNENSQTRVVALSRDVKDKNSLSGDALEVACWTTGSGSQTGGLSLKLGNYNHANEGLGDGYDELFIRYYIMFDKNYRAVRNHGANLGGRDVTTKNAAWVGMAGIRDVSTRGYFYSGVQPRGKTGSEELEMGFYSYHLDKKGPWGENYEVKRNILVKVGKWYCVERHLKLNSVDPNMADPANADGLEELWINGQLTIRKEGVRFRRVPHLRITFFSLETYYHGLPEQYHKSNPIRVYFDNLVIARKYVGPVHRKTVGADKGCES